MHEFTFCEFRCNVHRPLCSIAWWCVRAVLSHFSCVWLLVRPWTVARQAPLPMGFSRQEYWAVSPRPPPGHLPDPGIEPASLALQILYQAICRCLIRCQSEKRGKRNDSAMVLMSLPAFLSFLEVYRKCENRCICMMAYEIKDRNSHKK